MNAGRGTALFAPESRVRLVIGIAGAVQLTGLALVLGGGSAWAAVALLAAGVLLGARALVEPAVAAMIRDRGWIALALVLAVVGSWFALAVLRIAHTSLVRLPTDAAFDVWRGPTQSVVGHAPLLAAIVLTAACGLVLIADAVRVWLGLTPLQRAPWKQMTDVRETPDGIVSRGLAGVGLITLSAFLAIDDLGRYVTGDPGLQVIVLLFVAVGAGLLVGTPVAIGSLMRVDRDKAGRAREIERQRFAAHLHDSVLQTLALVQRQAHDPVAVARLARRQEHALRAWMAGEADLLSETVAGALRDIVASVEDEHAVAIELTAVGDRELDPAGEALVAAAREALRNAARHAPGAPVFVYAEMFAHTFEVFVRDEGPGFDAGIVPAERRGIRDAIVGRMASAGGTATIDSVTGEGTEVALRIPNGKTPRR